MSDVIDLDQHRPPESPYRSCQTCGCTQFRLVPVRLENGTFLSGITYVAVDNTLGGYSGLLICDECYAELDTGVRELPAMPYTSGPAT